MKPAGAVRWPLSERIQRLLRWGDVDGRYQSRSELFMALVTAMVAARWPSDLAWRVLSDPRNAGGEPVRTTRKGKPRPHPRAYFERAWEKAVRYLADHPPLRDRGDVLVALTGIREAANATTWRGRSGATDRVVLDALIDLALGAGRMRIHASTRELAVMTGVSPDTANAALYRLAKAGWIAKVSPATPVRAAVWKLKVKQTRTGRSGFGGEDTDHLSISPDAFGWPALGWSAGHVYAALSSNEPRSTADIATRMGTTERTALRHLTTLRSHGLADRVLDGWVRGPADPEDVARALGTAGRQDARREQYEAARRQRRAFFEREDVDVMTGEVRHQTPPGRSGFG